MALRIKYHQHILNFTFDAGTSRGIMRTRTSWFVQLYDSNSPECIGIGEVAPLLGLSVESMDSLEPVLQEIKHNLLQQNISFEDGKSWLTDCLQSYQNLPSILFAIETAWLDLVNGGKRILFDNDFTQGKSGIPINGLVWMGSKDAMLKQLQEKIASGFECVKIKVGAIDFEEECELIAWIRSHYKSNKITLRLDANGAWGKEEALKKLERLAQFDIHSIEQPIKAQQPQAMREVCAQSPIPIALDEELIGLMNSASKEQLLDTINPAYLIFKPSLIGGFGACNEWIALCKERAINWWLTSALESNLGLNAIAQYTASLNIGNFPQGLGTGQLYSNNIPSPLYIAHAQLHTSPNQTWDLSQLNC